MLQAAKDGLDVGIIVADIDASLHFYCELLGLERVERLPVSNGIMHRLRFGDSHFKVIDPTHPPPPGPVGVNGQMGYRSVAFCITNLSQVCAALRDQGVPFEVEEKQARPGVRIAMVRDPDGNIVEFVERS